MKLLENPLIKVVGICVIIYFALFHNKNNPQSLGNRFSSQQIKKDLNDMQEKGKFIASNVQAVRSYTKAQEVGPDGQVIMPTAELEVAVKDVGLGSGKKSVVCGEEVEAFISLNSDKARNLMTNPSAKFLIGSKEHWLVEKNIIGMKKGGVREIRIPQGFQSDDRDLTQFLQENKVDLTYQIILTKIIKDADPKSNLTCE